MDTLETNEPLPFYVLLLSVWEFAQTAELTSDDYQQEVLAFLMGEGCSHYEMSMVMRCLNDLFHPNTVKESAVVHHYRRVFTRNEMDILPDSVRGFLYELGHGDNALHQDDYEMVVHALLHLSNENITVETAKALTMLRMRIHAQSDIFYPFPLLPEMRPFLN